MASPSATSRRIEPRLRPINRTSSIPGNLIASSAALSGAADDIDANSDLQLRRIQSLGGAEQVALGLAIGHVRQRDGRLLIGVDDLALSVRQPLRNPGRQIAVQIIGIDLYVAVRSVELLS